MLKQKFLLFAGLMAFMSYACAKSSDEFPNRRLFPAVPVISMQDLYKVMDKVIIVDARSTYEYDTINITKAINIPVDEPDFVARMRKLRSENPKTQIVAYCNGKTCKKSYQAVQKCRNAGIRNVVAYDQGIFDWAKQYPQTARLLGKSPVDVKKLISKSDLEKHMINVDQFQDMASRSDVMVLDIRDPVQREATSLFPGIDKDASLDNKAKLDRYLNMALAQHKKLLVYDAAGKQVEWLMYYLQDKGMNDFAFMRGGAHGYYTVLRKQFLNRN